MGFGLAMLGGALISGGLSYLGAKKQSKASESAAESQMTAEQASLDLQRRMWETGRSDLFGNAGPRIWSEARKEGLTGLKKTIEDYRTAVRFPNVYRESPDFSWRRKEFENALLRGASAGGSLDEGGFLKRFGEASGGFAAGGYNDYLNRLTNQANLYSGLSGAGLGLAGQAAQAGSQYAAGGSNALSNIGSAYGSNAINQANVATGLYSNIANIGSNALNQYMMYQGMGGGGGYQLPADIASFNPNALISNMAV